MSLIAPCASYNSDIPIDPVLLAEDAARAAAQAHTAQAQAELADDEDEDQLNTHLTPKEKKSADVCKTRQFKVRKSSMIQIFLGLSLM
jgi:hypothetical protein